MRIAVSTGVDSLSPSIMLGLQVAGLNSQNIVLIERPTNVEIDLSARFPSELFDAVVVTENELENIPSDLIHAEPGRLFRMSFWLISSQNKNLADSHKSLVAHAGDPLTIQFREEVINGCLIKVEENKPSWISNVSELPLPKVSKVEYALIGSIQDYEVITGNSEYVWLRKKQWKPAHAVGFYSPSWININRSELVACLGSRFVLSDQADSDELDYAKKMVNAKRWETTGLDNWERDSLKAIGRLHVISAPFSTDRVQEWLNSLAILSKKITREMVTDPGVEADVMNFTVMHKLLNSESSGVIGRANYKYHVANQSWDRLQPLKDLARGAERGELIANRLNLVLKAIEKYSDFFEELDELSANKIPVEISRLQARKNIIYLYYFLFLHYQKVGETDNANTNLSNAQYQYKRFGEELERVKTDDSYKSYGVLRDGEEFVVLDEHYYGNKLLVVRDAQP